MTFRRVAVLNRGEAAVRFLRTFRAWRRNRDLDIEVVAFATDPDRHAPFVRLADSVCALGPALVTRPDGRVLSAYCDQPAVMAALAAAGCDAVWPGWGFVSEDAAFVEGLEAAGITFIGPRSETLRWLGDKIAARRQAEAAGVPLAPWATLPQDSPVQSWQEAASRVGYPLMVKASAGGGGRGIRRVDVPADLPAALVAVRGEADRSFGGGGILLEACMQGARHVEVQLVGDGRGTAWGLGVRDCSIQRRHQKILEECPSPVLDAERTTLLQRSAADLAGRVNYRGVGTAEFLYVPSTGDHRLPRGQRAPAGGAPADRAACSAAIWWRPSSTLPRASAGRRPPRRPAAMPSKRASTPKIRPRASCPDRGVWCASARRPARASGWTRAWKKARPWRPSSTR
jgi:acetyl/propionyl-CoA carboxylase alpha subunit